MTPTVVSCPNCSRSYKIPADRLGHKLKCKCGHVWKAEAAAQAPAALAAAPVKPQPVKPEPLKAEPVKPQSVEPPGDTPVAVARPVDVTDRPTPPARVYDPQQAKAIQDAKGLIGRELGTFRIEDLLGVGGFGAVYRAFDKSLHRHVALKVLPPQMARAGKEKVQHFLQEARSAAKLSHPNIVTVHQICQVDGLYFIVMELVDGRTLADVVRQKRLTPQDATRIITEASRGLAHAHRRGLIHRDIKPGNIMVTADNQVKMTDFGLARDIFRDTSDAEDGRAVGTPLYMAPEQCEGEEGDSRSDVYSMAASYYVALTRRPPYEGRDTEEVMNRHRFDPPPDPRQYVPGLPAAVFRIIEKAMAKNPDERYQTAVDLLAALEALDFAALDPNSSISLEAVSAQIGALTPQVGSHVGAVMKQAVRRADISTSRIRVAETIEKVTPLKWYIIGGVAVAVVCIVAVVVAIILAVSNGHNDEGQGLTPIGPVGESATPAASTSSKNPKEQGPPSTTTTQPDTTTTQPATATTPRQASPVADTTESVPEPAGQTKSYREMMLEGVKLAFEAAEKFDRENVALDAAKVVSIYQDTVISVYVDDLPDNEYVKKAQARIEELRRKAGGDDADSDKAAPEGTGNGTTSPAPEDCAATE
ncbi:MAG: protein kinase [Planctomycetes bacterium]|nr:protein kinase [Planctomycetota bacterium]